MKKATMKDIAQIAGVSVATVSYVLNNVENQSIPASTRCKIVQIAKELEYTPNLAARSLGKKKTGLIGILICKDPCLPYWKRQNHLSFADELERLLTNAGYHTLLITLDSASPSLDVIVERSLEAVFLVDVTDDLFYSISSRFTEGIPLILIDSLVEDKLFKQINYDYHSALLLAAETIRSPYCLVMEHNNNKSLTRYIRESLSMEDDAIFTVNTLADLNGLMIHDKYEHAIVINEFLGSHVERLHLFSNLTVICTCSCPEILTDQTRKLIFEENKASTAFRIMKRLIDNDELDPRDDSKIFVKARI